jgi:hypothetical protein
MRTLSTSVPKALILGAATAAMIGLAAPARADVFHLSYSGTITSGVDVGNAISGSLTVDTGAGGIPGVAGSLSGTVVTASGSSHSVSLLPPRAYIDNDNFIGDGPWPPATVVDNPGLAFATDGADSIWINIFSYDSGGGVGAYRYWESLPGDGPDGSIGSIADAIQVTLTPIGAPAPAPGPLPGVGLLGLAGLVLASGFNRARAARG